LSEAEVDPRLKALNAIVFLSLKPKGNRNVLTPLRDREAFSKFIQTCLDAKLNFGFDSCTASNFLSAVKSQPEYEKLQVYVDPCESFGLFSGYINVDGKYFPCSFAEGEGEWVEGLDLLTCNSFMEDIWFNPLLNKYRNLSLDNLDCNGCRQCLLFDLELI